MTFDVRIHDVLRRAAAISPAATAATLTGDSWSFGELDELARRSAWRLLATARGDRGRVVWWGPTSLDALAVRFGASQAGLLFAPLDPGMTDDEVSAAIGLLQPDVTVADPERAERLRAIGVDVVVVAERGWLDRESAVESERVGSSEDPATIFLTSGSTGVPKAALVSHRATWLRAVQRDASPGRADHGGQVNMFGLGHMAGWWVIEQSWASDRAVHLVHRADAGELLDAVERHRASTLYCIPGVWQRILDHGGDADTSSLRETLTGTSYVEPAFLAALKERFPGTWTSVAYGSTEIGRGAVLADHDLFRKPGSVGRPHVTVDARFADDGELLLRGPTLFSGYLDRPDATADAIDADGWYHSGDLATQDDEGYLSIVGRRSETIRTGGEWVAPTEVEAALADHPALTEVAVFGVADPSWGEVVCAAVVVRRGHAAPNVDELRAHLDGRLASSKQPRRVVEVDALPRTGETGQVRRAALRAMFG